jgi:hypothetical protein
MYAVLHLYWQSRPQIRGRGKDFFDHFQLESSAEHDFPRNPPEVSRGVVAGAANADGNG